MEAMERLTTFLHCTRPSSLSLSQRGAPKSVYEYETIGESTAKATAHALHPQWVRWSQQELERGIDSRAVLDELVAFGYEPAKNPLFTQQLLRTAAAVSPEEPRNDSSSPRPARSRSPLKTCASLSFNLEATTSKGSAAAHTNAPRRYTFLRCLEEGALAEVELFVSAGQDVNAATVDPHSHVALPPLHVACKRGHTTVARFLLDHGACVDLTDEFQRTPLMVAARSGSFPLCDLLLHHDASLFRTDALENTPLHMAAYGGCAKTVELLLSAHDGRLLLHVANLPRVRGTSYRALLQAAFDALMQAKLRENERRRFHVSWVREAAQWMLHALFQDERVVATATSLRDWPRPQQFYVDYLVEQYHDKFAKRSTTNDSDGDSDDDTDQEPDATDWISLEEMAFYVDKSLRETFKHLRNKQGRTALHVACDENLVCTHELAIRALADRNGVSPLLRDHSGLAPLQLVLACRGRPGSPKGDAELETQYVTRRDDRLRRKQQRQEADRVAQRRQRWQDELDAVASDFNDLETLTTTQKLLTQQGQAPSEHVAGWDVFEEPLSRNRLFVNTRSGFVQRQVPTAVVAAGDERLGWKEKLKLHAHLVERNREQPDWELHRVNSADVYFFYHRIRQHCQWLKPADAPSGWRAKRIFNTQEDMDDESDRTSLVVAFSGQSTPAITTDAVRGRRLGKWRECGGFQITFYVCEDSGDDGDGKEVLVQRVALDKPPEVLQHESYRYAEVHIRERSEEIEEVRALETCRLLLVKPVRQRERGELTLAGACAASTTADGGACTTP